MRSRHPSVRYVSHSGREVDLSGGPIRCNSGEWMDFSRDADVSGATVLSTSFSAFERDMDLVVASSSSAEADEARDELSRAIAEGASTGKAGRLYFDDWFIECVPVSLHASSYTMTPAASKHTATFIVSSAWWKRERRHVLAPSESSDGLGYPHGYPHGYGYAAPTDYIDIDTDDPCDVSIEFRGPVDSPSISIGPNRYSAEVLVPSGWLLRIDTRDYAAELVSDDGMLIDVLSSTPDAPPGSGEYVFERMKAGRHAVSRSGSYPAFVTVFERKAIRPWC